MSRRPAMAVLSLRAVGAILAAFGSLLGLAGAAPLASAAAPGVQTLVSLKTPVYAFAQDGPRIAWTTSDPKCDVAVVVRTVPTGAQSTLTRPGGMTCKTLANYAYGAGTRELVLAGTIALWGIVTESNTATDIWLVAGSPGTTDREIADVEFQGGITKSNPKLPVVPVAGRGATLAFAAVGAGDTGEVTRIVAGKAVGVGGLRCATALAADGSRLAAAEWLTAGLPLSDEPTWSPNGKLIAFHSERESVPGIDVVAPDGSGLRRIASGPLFEPAWSPDGKQLAYVDNNGTFFAANADGSGAHRIFAKAEAEQPSWSPDGRRIAFIADDGLYAVGADGTGAKPILKDPSPSLMGFRYQNPAWSPDGKLIAFNDVGPTMDDDKLDVIAPDGTGRKVIGEGLQPAWSPDGSMIAVSASCSIEVLKADGTGVRTLTKPRGTNCDSKPSWNGSALVFARGETDVTGELEIVSADGSGLHQVPTGAVAARRAEIVVQGGATIPNVQPKAIALSGNALAALVGGAIDIFDAASGKLLRTVHVPAETAPSLSLSGTRLVFAVNRTIELLDTQTGALKKLAVASSTPIGLSIASKRIAWGESTSSGGRIRAVELP